MLLLHCCVPKTPMKLAVAKPSSIAEQYVEAMSGFYLPALRKQSRLSLSDSVGSSCSSRRSSRNYQLLHQQQQQQQQQQQSTHRIHPLLVSQSNWTRNDARHRSSCNANGQREFATNLLDGNERSMWTAAAGANGRALNWIVFDLKAEHCISRLRIYSW